MKTVYEFFLCKTFYIILLNTTDCRAFLYLTLQGLKVLLTMNQLTAIETHAPSHRTVSQARLTDGSEKKWSWVFLYGAVLFG